MKVKQYPVGPLESNCYILYDENSLEALIIDAGADAPKIVDFLQQNSLTLKGIILTHYHSDHVGAAEKIKQATGAPIYIHKDDEISLLDLARFKVANLLRPRIEVTPDHLLEDGDTLKTGSITVKVVHTPGHTTGSICLEVVGENIVFTGDTVFADSIGRTDFGTGDPKAMRISLRDKVNSWSNQMTICPGHGPSATMAQVRAHNWLFRTTI